MERIPIVEEWKDPETRCHVLTVMDYNGPRACFQKAHYTLGGQIPICRKHIESLARNLAKALGYKLVKVKDA